jgi:probable HAF family extracellular repeat protein
MLDHGSALRRQAEGGAMKTRFGDARHVHPIRTGHSRRGGTRDHPRTAHWISLAGAAVAAIVFVLATSGAGSAAESVQARWAIRDLGTLGGPWAYVMAINERGQVVGWAHTKAGVQHVFLWQNGKMRDLGARFAGGDNGGEPTINKRGQVVGTSCPGVGTRCRAFLWQNGTMTDLGTLVMFPESTAVAINEHDQIIGQAWSSASDSQHAVLWTPRVPAAS